MNQSSDFSKRESPTLVVGSSQMDGIEFENLKDAKFQKMGYTTKLTKATKDYGVDLIATKNKKSIIGQEYSIL